MRANEVKDLVDAIDRQTTQNTGQTEAVRMLCDAVCSSIHEAAMKIEGQANLLSQAIASSRDIQRGSDINYGIPSRFQQADVIININVPRNSSVSLVFPSYFDKYYC